MLRNGFGKGIKPSGKPPKPTPPPPTNETEGLTLLGQAKTVYPEHPDQARLETFENRCQDRDYVIILDCPEFTSLCPKTHQPDFAKLMISYRPDKLCVESKSLKLYLYSFRNFGGFMEHITNRILDDLVHVCKPKWMSAESSFFPRGGIVINVYAEYSSSGVTTSTTARRKRRV